MRRSALFDFAPSGAMLMALMASFMILGGCTQKPLMRCSDDGSSVTIFSGDDPVLTYNYAVTPPPEGVSHLFERSGYIHPAYTPSGTVITNIQPEDHYHHYGIWNPWTRVEFEGTVYDLWNLGDSLGTVRASGVTSFSDQDGYAGFTASLEHIAFAPQGEEVIMNEEWQVAATETEDGYLWDFTSTLEALHPLIIKEYRYQGFGIRATADWTEEETTMMTSEGLSRDSIDASRGRWIYVNGKGKCPDSGILIMACPANHNSPEPLRIWTKGDVFVNFCPAKTADWTLEPGQKYQLKYRILTYDGEMNPEKAENLWKEFAAGTPHK